MEDWLVAEWPRLALAALQGLAAVGLAVPVLRAAEFGRLKGADGGGPETVRSVVGVTAGLLGLVAAAVPLRGMLPPGAVDVLLTAAFTPPVLHLAGRGRMLLAAAERDETVARILASLPNEEARRWVPRVARGLVEGSAGLVLLAAWARAVGLHDIAGPAADLASFAVGGLGALAALLVGAVTLGWLRGNEGGAAARIVIVGAGLAAVAAVEPFLGIGLLVLLFTAFGTLASRPELVEDALAGLRLRAWVDEGDGPRLLDWQGEPVRVGEVGVLKTELETPTGRRSVDNRELLAAVRERRQLTGG